MVGRWLWWRRIKFYGIGILLFKLEKTLLSIFVIAISRSLFVRPTPPQKQPSNGLIFHFLSSHHEPMLLCQWVPYVSMGLEWCWQSGGL